MNNKIIKYSNIVSAILVLTLAVSSYAADTESSYIAFRNPDNLSIRFDLFRFEAGDAKCGEWKKQDRYFSGNGGSVYFKVSSGFYSCRVIYNQKQYVLKDNIEKGKFYTFWFDNNQLKIEYKED